jgi:hypothetical protein
MQFGNLVFEHVIHIMHCFAHTQSDEKSDDLPNVIARQSSHYQQPVAEPLNVHQLLQTYLEIAGFRSNAETNPTQHYSIK